MATGSGEEFNPAYATFRKHSADLLTVIQDPEVLAWELYAESVITAAVRNAANNLIYERGKRTSDLLAAVDSRIVVDPGAFDVFLYVLNKRPAMSDLCERMKDMYSTALLHSQPSPRHLGLLSSPPAKRPKIDTTPVQQYSPPSSPMLISEIEIAGETSLVITGNEEHHYHWKGYGFKLHVPRNALKSGVSDCTLHVKAFLPNNYLELPENTKLVSAIYYISTPSPSALREGVDIQIEHCCKLVEGYQERLRFVTSESAQWERASFSYIDGGHFYSDSSYGRISLHHFSWFAVVWQVWQGIRSLFSVTRYCIKVYLESVYLTQRYIHFILITNLEVNLKAIETKYACSQNELFGGEAIFDDDSDEVVLDIDKNGEETEEGWSIVPLMDPPSIKMESAGYFRPGRQPPECKLVARASTPQHTLLYELNLKGLKQPLSIKLHYFPVQAITHAGRTAGTASKASEPKIFSEKPTNRDLTLLKWRDGGEVCRLELVDTILNDWRTIGNILHISQPKLDTWWTQTNHDPKRCCDNVLAHWLQNPPEEYPPTWHGLIDLLKDAKFSTLVQELKKAIVNKV